MTPELLISEGRKLARPCVVLRPNGTGPVAAIWHEADAGEIEATGYHCWISVDARFVPGLRNDLAGYISIFTYERACEGGRVDIASAWPKRLGVELYAAQE